MGMSLIWLEFWPFDKNQWDDQGYTFDCWEQNFLGLPLEGLCVITELETWTQTHNSGDKVNK